LVSPAATAERIRNRIAALAVPLAATELNVTVSIGVRSDLGQAIEIDEMLRAADGALFEAKNTGRNRVVTAPDRVVAWARSARGVEANCTT
jgi:diguanylate cyclase (GGDEF)-like protein